MFEREDGILRKIDYFTLPRTKSVMNVEYLFLSYFTFMGINIKYS